VVDGCERLCGLELEVHDAHILAVVKVLVVGGLHDVAQGLEVHRVYDGECEAVFMGRLEVTPPGLLVRPAGGYQTS